MAKRQKGKKPPLHAGMRVGNWKLVSRLGRGGQGEVWEARDAAGAPHTISRAIKICLDTNESARARFSQEVKILQQYTHPGIIPIIESNLNWGHNAGDISHCAYYVMPKAEGSILSIPHLARDTLTILGLFRDICLAIDFLHTQDEPVLHRDLKPDNILILSEKFRAILGDFGIAAPIESQGSLTKTNEVVGSHMYRAPEIYAGGSATEKSDIYGLGRILEHLLTGQKPQDVPPRPIPLERHLSDRARESLSAILAQACAYDPNQRFHSVRDLIDALPNFVIDVSGSHEHADRHAYRASGTGGPEAVQLGQEIAYVELIASAPKWTKKGWQLHLPLEITNTGPGPARACRVSVAIGELSLQEMPLDTIPGNGKAIPNVTVILPTEPKATGQVLLILHYENIYGKRFITSYSLADWDGRNLRPKYERI
jgi:serine/threonine protein kinase